MFTERRICGVFGHLKYNTVRLHARRALHVLPPCKRIQQRCYREMYHLSPGNACRNAAQKSPKEAGSILIVVLWILVLIGFLAQEYLTHNREKAALALTTRQELEIDLAIDSLLALYESGNWPESQGEGTSDPKEQWLYFAPSGLKLWAKMEDDSHRHNLNSASEDKVRAVIHALLGQETDRADEITDAILDWRDDDDLTHEHGAEEKEYEDMEADYLPANGPFKSLTELLLVKGVYPSLFWGNPLGLVQEALESAVEAEKLEADDSLPRVDSLLDGFTLYSGDIKRLSIVVPGDSEAYFFMVLFLSKARNGKWAVTSSHFAWLTPPEEGDFFASTGS